tara:strand:- start:649 stop:1461 length:813 start_codon:yes stop_codon:yes gene_type:complete
MGSEVLGTFSSFKNTQPAGENSLGQTFFDFMEKAKPVVKAGVEAGVEAGVDAAVTAGGVVKDSYNILTTTPIKTFMDDIFNQPSLSFLNRTITETNFSPESISVLKQYAKDKGLKAGQSITIDYEDFNKYGAKMSARLYSGSNESWNVIRNKLLNMAPADEVKMTLGEATLEADDNGDIKVIDRYNFNDWVWFGKGKQEDGTYLSLSAEEFEAGDQITFMEAMIDTINNAPTAYQAARNLGFLFGSRDYKDDTRDQGRPVEINLGNVKDL